MVTASTPPKLLDFVAVLGTKLSTYQRVLLMAFRADQ
jgi:hypothetical protein